MLALALLLAALGSLAQPALADGGFATTCFVMTANLTNNWLGLYCNSLDTADFAYNWTWINLNRCLGNDLGELFAKDSGDFFSSCNDCQIQPSGKDPHQTLNLTCACRDPSGKASPSSLDLNTTVTNNNGAMGCFGHMGNKTDVGPPCGNFDCHD